MKESRRGFLKKALGATAATAAVATVASASSSKGYSDSNGVVIGKSNKKEITYKKTKAWEDYYKSAI